MRHIKIDSILAFTQKWFSCLPQPPEKENGIRQFEFIVAQKSATFSNVLSIQKQYYVETKKIDFKR